MQSINMALKRDIPVMNLQVNCHFKSTKTLNYIVDNKIGV